MQPEVRRSEIRSETQIDTKDRATIYSRPISPWTLSWVAAVNEISEVRVLVQVIKRPVRMKVMSLRKAVNPGTAQFGFRFKLSEPTDFR